MKLPEALVEDIEAGRCVAFVGSGFSVPAFFTWKRLLEILADRVPAERRAEVLALIGGDSPSARDFEAAAQLVQDAREGAFEDDLRELFTPRWDELSEGMRRRLRWLRGIPFSAILTTNIDGLLQGETPRPDAYVPVLRPAGHRWWDERFWDGDHPEGPRTVKLHGDIEQGDFVFSRRDYRRRLYETPSYMTFLRAVFSTRTVVYMGFSFTDEYLNEVRSEVLSMLGHRSTERPIAYALVADVSPEIARYYARHEGIEIIPFDTRGGTDFSSFDGFLQRLYERTNPRHLLGKLLSGRRLLWLDPNPPNNVFGERLLSEAAAEAGGECPIHRVDTWEEAVAQLGEQDFDLVITHWGHEAARDQGLPGSVAEKLLDEMHGRRLGVPVVVFAAYPFADENKARALRAGAVAYTFSWSRLFQTIADIFRPGTETG
jgi:hypothetical protein